MPWAAINCVGWRLDVRTRGRASVDSAIATIGLYIEADDKRSACLFHDGGGQRVDKAEGREVREDLCGMAIEMND